MTVLQSYFIPKHNLYILKGTYVKMILVTNHSVVVLGCVVPPYVAYLGLHGVQQIFSHFVFCFILASNAHRVKVFDIFPEALSIQNCTYSNSWHNN